MNDRESGVIFRTDVSLASSLTTHDTLLDLFLSVILDQLPSRAQSSLKMGKKRDIWPFWWIPIRMLAILATQDMGHKQQVVLQLSEAFAAHFRVFWSYSGNCLSQIFMP